MPRIGPLRRANREDAVISEWGGGRGEAYAQLGGADQYLIGEHSRPPAASAVAHFTTSESDTMVAAVAICCILVILVVFIAIIILVGQSMRDQT
ncbi:unnamed protein product [Nezara viridula]|uniref:Uncharacterized protein n=1 Tax=Nezara viridula TaxID=85310 RepID=A0A9P0MLK0_NEZVI|nr:unnamed protein product [Nezara viridula]